MSEPVHVSPEPSESIPASTPTLPDEPATEAAGALSDLQSPGSIALVLGRLQLGRYTGLLILAAFVVIFGFWVPDTFLTSTTVKSILSTQGVTAIAALAVVFPLAAGAFDLSIASNLGFSALVCGSLMANAPHTSPLVAIVLTLAMATGVGIVNGGLIAYVGMNSFVATLGTSSLLTAGLGVVANGEYAGPFPKSFTGLTTPTPLGIPIIAFYVVALAFIMWYVLEHTPIGRRVYAVGANPDVARLSGVRVRRHVFASLVVCGLGGGIAGILLASSIGTVNETSGVSYLLPAYAAAFLATTQIKPGRFNVWGTILAIVLLGTGVQGLQLVGAQAWATDVFNGVALLGAVTVAIVLERQRGRREKARIVT